MPTAISNPDFENSKFKQRSANWASIRLHNIYRLGLAGIFFSQSFADPSPLLIINDLTFYAWVSLTFLVLSLVWMLAASIERRGFEQQLSLQIYSDIILIILIMHACGGITSGLGMLLIISIAVTSLLTKQSLAIIFASLASIGLLAQHIYSVMYINGYAGSSTQVGILGASLFATAIVMHKLTLRLRRSERLVQKRERTLALLSALNQEIIENLQAGVIVLSKNHQVRHINKTALQMLNIPSGTAFSLKRDQPKLLALLELWRDNSERDIAFLPAESGMDNLQISFRLLQRNEQKNTLIFLNDVSSIKHSMQQAKLASLGHLTASIAHEIRNPLGAISYAAQLLEENENLQAAEKRMAQIIHQHTGRINHIIEDILQLSRRSSTMMEKTDLHQWLSKFIDDFCLSKQIDPDKLELNIDPANAVIYFDQAHLTQIMTNLCDNAYSHGDQQKPVHIRVYHDQTDALQIEVADQGPGIREQDLDNIWEPFFTTSHQGSGLGLYIVNQLCELNNASILARNNQYGGASFVIQPATSAPNQS